MDTMIVICGAGAIGSQIAMAIADPAYQYLIIDDDRVEINNVITGTSAYSLHHVGAMKAMVLAEMMYRKCGARADADIHTLRHVRPLRNFKARLYIDTFDNDEARYYTTMVSPTVHIGVSEARTGLVAWDSCYSLGYNDDFERGDNPVCTNHLGRHILRLTSAVAATIIEDYLQTGQQRSVVVTQRMNVLG